MIGKMHLAGVAEQLEGQVRGDDVSFEGVSTDTRQIKDGELFVALVGPNFNGNQFVDTAAEQGACAAIVSEPVEASIPTLLVKDTCKALGLLGRINRDEFTGGVAAITGSSGKTTVKEMVAQMMRCRGKVLATKGNLNNHIGAPLTLLSLNDEHQNAVVELGASAVGEIAYTVALTKPDVATITNVAAAHLGGFGSLQGTANAKGEIFNELTTDGTAVINIDDDFCGQWLKQVAQLGCKVFTFSMKQNGEADFYARQLSLDESPSGQQDEEISFEMVTPLGPIDIKLPMMGRHNVGNALNAAAVALALGCDLGDIQHGLATVQPVKGRLVKHEMLDGWTVIDDTYNANPGSMVAAIDVLSLHTSNPTSNASHTVFVMGDMGELGDKSIEAHRDIGLYAKKQGIHTLVGVGALSQHAVDAFGENGQWFEQQSQAIESLKAQIKTGTVLLVKGSRSAAMENIVNTLVKE